MKSELEFQLFVSPYSGAATLNILKIERDVDPREREWFDKCPFCQIWTFNIRSFWQGSTVSSTIMKVEINVRGQLLKAEARNLEGELTRNMAGCSGWNPWNLRVRFASILLKSHLQQLVGWHSRPRSLLVPWLQGNLGCRRYCCRVAIPPNLQKRLPQRRLRIPIDQPNMCNIGTCYHGNRGNQCRPHGDSYISLWTMPNAENVLKL